MDSFSFFHLSRSLHRSVSLPPSLSALVLFYIFPFACHPILYNNRVHYHRVYIPPAPSYIILIPRCRTANIPSILYIVHVLLFRISALLSPIKPSISLLWFWEIRWDVPYIFYIISSFGLAAVYACLSLELPDQVTHASLTLIVYISYPCLYMSFLTLS